MATRAIRVQVDGVEVSLGLDEMGRGPTVALLPALSSISTRSEMYPLMERLAPRFRTLAMDWPGFGDGAKPRADWSPPLLQGFLERVLREEAPGARAPSSPQGMRRAMRCRRSPTTKPVPSGLS